MHTWCQVSASFVASPRVMGIQGLKPNSVRGLAGCSVTLGQMVNSEHVICQSLELPVLQENSVCSWNGCSWEDRKLRPPPNLPEEGPGDSPGWGVGRGGWKLNAEKGLSPAFTLLPCDSARWSWTDFWPIWGDGIDVSSHSPLASRRHARIWRVFFLFVCFIYVFIVGALVCQCWDDNLKVHFLHQSCHSWGGTQVVRLGKGHYVCVQKST